MARLATRPTPQVPELEDIAAALERGPLGMVPNSFATMAHRPDLARAFVMLTGVVMGPGRVDPGLKQLVAFVVSSSAGSAYCQAHTAMVADELGIDPTKLAQIGEFDASPQYSPPERAALRVAVGAGQVPNAVTDEQFAELREHFDSEQIVELVGVIATFGFLNRWNETMATTLEASPLAFAQEHLAVRGWRGDKHVEAEPAPVANEAAVLADEP